MTQTPSLYLVDDPLYSDNPKRVENRVQLGQVLSSVFGRLTRAEAIARLEANRLAWSNVSTVADLSGHAALRRIDVDVPGGRFRGVGSPLRNSIKGGPVPALGAHTEAVRREFAEVQA